MSSDQATPASSSSPGLALPARSRERKPSIVTLGAGLFSIEIKNDKSESKSFQALPKVMQDLHGKELEATYLDLSDPAKRQQKTLTHNDEVMSLSFSSDGESLVAGGEDCEVILWNIPDKTRLMEVKCGHPVKAVAYAPNGKHIAAGDEDGTITLWDITSKAEVATAQVNGSVLSMAISSSPDFLAVGTTDKVVTLFSLPGLDEIAVLNHDGDVRSLSFSPDGKTLAGGGGTDNMHGLMTKKSTENKMKTVIWQVDMVGDNCKHLGTIESNDVVHTVAFSPSGELLATGCEGRQISLLLVNKNFEKTGDLLCPAGVRSISWSPDSHFLASCGEDMQVSVWDLLTEKVIFQLPKAKDWLCAVAFSPARTKELWIASCGFGCKDVSLCPVSLCLLSEQPVTEDGAPRRRFSMGGCKPGILP